MAGKRSYVGVKMKRKAMLEKDPQKRFKGNPNSLTTHLIQQFGLGSVVGLIPQDQPATGSAGPSHANSSNSGNNGSKATSNAPYPTAHTAVHTAASSSGHSGPSSVTASLLSLSEEQRRFYEMYPHLRPPQHQGSFFPPQYSAGGSAQYPYMLPYSAGVPPGSQPSMQYLPAGYPMSLGQYPYGSFPQGYPHTYGHLGQPHGTYFAPMMSHSPGTSGQLPMPIPYMGNYPGMPSHMTSAGMPQSAPASSIVRDQSTIEAAAQLGRLMSMATQDLDSHAPAPVTPRNGGSLSSGTSPAHSVRTATASGQHVAHVSSAEDNDQAEALRSSGDLDNDQDNDNEDADGGEEEELDWREQLYYWTGLLYYDPARCMQVWKGSWVGSYTGKPLPEEFSWSFNHFEYTTPVGKSAVTSEGVLKEPQSGDLRGFYLMDNDGSGALERYEDTEYSIEFDKPSPLNSSSSTVSSSSSSSGSSAGVVPVQYAVVGRGDSDFGAFVVSGVLNKQTMVLEMTRRYVAETDVRSRMSIAQLRELFRTQPQLQ